jgi:CheY-like chemotaxis protein
MEIVGSKVSVYEIELDLKSWTHARSNTLGDFPARLMEAIPSLINHKCMDGKYGGFARELQTGTDMAHVIEHVILELLHLSDPQGMVFTGWTRKHAERPTYVIHFNAPDFMSARLAAVLGLKIVKDLLENRPAEVSRSIADLKNQASYLTRDEAAPPEIVAEPVSVIQEISPGFSDSAASESAAPLDPQDRQNIRDQLRQLRGHLPQIASDWKHELIRYGGDFCRAVVDKLALLNLDRFLQVVEAGDFDGLRRGIRRASGVVFSYRIPSLFVFHSIWIYKTRLNAQIKKHHRDEPLPCGQNLQSFERLYQQIFEEVQTADNASRSQPDLCQELQQFRELKRQNGTILVIDDDRIVLQVCRQMLKNQNFNVLTAADSQHGLEIFLQHRQEIQLILQDLWLPNAQTGSRLFLQLRKTDPTVKILLMTGYAANEICADLREDRNSDIVLKPFTVDSLTQKVQALLDVGQTQASLG